MDATGYLHRAYAASLSEFGTPRLLPASDGWFLERTIPGTSESDGMGCYPVLSCRDWRRLPADLNNIEGLVCLSAVTDPFGEYDPALLRACFPDWLIPFKKHFFADLDRDPEQFVSPHHRRNARKALAAVNVEYCECPAVHADEWIDLYRQLIERHSIRGIAAFSDTALRRQLEVPGLEMFRATYAGETVGIVLWMVQNGIAYYHLAAYSEAGYRSRASFALFWTAFQCFADRGLRRLSLGAGAGIRDDGANGLNRFKRGWSTGTQTAYLGGRVLDRRAYARLQGATPPDDYFPGYRKGEFG